MIKNDSDSTLEALIQEVIQSPRYRTLSPDLVRQIAKRELAKGRKFKEAVKTTRSKLHQVAVAYQEKPVPYSLYSQQLSTLPAKTEDSQLQSFCRQVMQLHASTNERLPILETFFTEILTPLGPIHSIMDLACGLTPLCIPWMPLAENAQYYACDVYEDMLNFINDFLNHIRQPGQAEMVDLSQSCPVTPVDVALLLKSVPCLEQIDKQVIPRLLDNLPARHIIVSFPAQSLGGREKGMAQFYSEHFLSLVEGKPFSIRNYSFKSEIAFCLSRIQTL